MKVAGYDFTLRVRKLPPPLPVSIRVNLARLEKGSHYSVPVGTIGVIDDTSADGQYHFVHWSTGGASGPILHSDLELLGEVYLPLEGDRDV